MIKEKIPAKYILPLIATSSALRKKNILTELLLLAKQKRIPTVKIYEVLLQTYLFAGFPSALISLKLFGEIFPSFKSKTENFNLAEIKKKGEETCKKVYGEKFKKLITNVKSFSPELSEWLVTEGYGKVLSRETLSLKEREMAIVSMLVVLKYEDQLYSHINGALRQGIKVAEISELIDLLKIFNNKTYPDFGKRVLQKFTKKNQK